MLHTRLASTIRSAAAPALAAGTPQPAGAAMRSLRLVDSSQQAAARPVSVLALHTTGPSSFFHGIALTASRRCSAFCAEAAVLVLVLTVLDRLIAFGHVELRWILSAIVISGVLLAISILLDHTSAAASLGMQPDH